MNHSVQNLLQASSIMLVAFFTGQLLPKSDATTISRNVQNITYVSFNEVKAAIANNDILIDARAASAFQAGHIPGAINLPAKSSDGEIQQALNKLANPKTRIITYCSDADCPDSHTLAIKLNQAGRDNVAVYKEGWQEWSIVQP